MKTFQINSSKNIMTSVVKMMKLRMIDADINILKDYYSSKFNKPLNESNAKIEEVTQEIEDIKRENYSQLNIDNRDLNIALKKTKNSNVIGNDGDS
jgi:hypothetical protein